jgi:hypothetical protein
MQTLTNHDVDIEMAPVVDGAVTTLPSGKLHGYPTFAAFVTRDQDAAIYRKFESLSARNLLYLQSEIHELQGQLEELDDADAKSSSFEVEGVARAWHHYSAEMNTHARKHRELQEKIRVKIKEYRKSRLKAQGERMRLTSYADEALILENQVLALQRPSSRTLRVFKQWFKASTRRPVLLGRDETLFDDEQDIVALAPVETDRLNVFLQAYFGRFFEVCPLKPTYLISFPFAFRFP